MRLKEIDWNTPETLTETVAVGIEPILFVLDQVYELVNVSPIYEPGRKENEILAFFVDFITNQIKDLKDHLMHLDEEGGVRIPGSIYRTADEVARRRGTSIELLFSDYVNNLMTGRESFTKSKDTLRTRTGGNKMDQIIKMFQESNKRVEKIMSGELNKNELVAAQREFKCQTKLISVAVHNYKVQISCSDGSVGNKMNQIAKMFQESNKRMEKIMSGEFIENEIVTAQREFERQIKLVKASDKPVDP